MRRILSCLAAAMSAAGTAAAGGEGCGLDAEAVFRAAAPSVVQVFSLAINPYLVRDRIDPRTGSGFVTPDGHVVTNYHVVADAGTVVVYLDDEAVEAEVVGIDPSLDIAVLGPAGAFGAGGLAFAPDGSERIGQPAYAVGYPLSLGRTISHGLVSGVHRVLPRTTSSWLSPYIQTDAAVSPGSSGGPLLDDCGRVLGMVTLIAGAGEDLGFAIPVGVVRPVVEELAATGHVSRPWHGLYGQMVSPPVLALMGVPFEDWDATWGFLVETVEPGSAADRAGLVGGEWPVMWGGTEYLIGGDIITEVNGTRIDSLDVALAAVRSLKIGKTVSIVALRDGERIEARVELEERPLIERELEVYRMRDPRE